MVTLANVASAPDVLGPLIANFPSLAPSTSTRFSYYTDSKAHQSSNKGFPRERGLLCGRNDNIEFLSINGDRVPTGLGPFSEYVVAVHNKETNKIYLRSAPLYILSRDVKRLRRAEAADSAVSKRLQARSALGQTFGSKKSRAAIQAAERNRVDVSAMKHIAHHLQEHVSHHTQMLPELGESAQGQLSWPGPPANLDAQEPAQVYPVNLVIPPAELKACRIRELFSAATTEERLRILPYNRSAWINGHLAFMAQQGRMDKLRLRLLFYISCMLCFRHAASGRGDINEVQGKMSRIPPLIQEGLWARYSEAARLSQRGQITTGMDVKLLSHMFVLCLIVDDFAADFATLASDLRSPKTRVIQIFRALGCKVDFPNPMERDRFHVSKEAAPDKRAFLRIPLDFPKVRRGRLQRS